MAREGQRPAPAEENFFLRPCHRPGCYVLVVVKNQRCGRCFCSLACRLALHRVEQREQRYQQRRRRWRRQRRERCRSRFDSS